LLAGISGATGMETVIIRPPLVYGPNVRANFRRLLRWVKKRIPLPLGMVNNRLSVDEGLMKTADWCLNDETNF